MNAIKTVTNLLGTWWLRQAGKNDCIDGHISDEIWNEKPAKNTGWYDSNQVLSVHEILINHDMLNKEVLAGKCESCTWVAEADWIYRIDFKCPEDEGGNILLRFKGLDTVADVYLNGSHIGWHDNMYLPFVVDVSGHMAAENTVIIYFHSPYKIMAQRSLPNEWRGVVDKTRLIRKPHMDYLAYLGVSPYLTPIGMFDDAEVIVSCGAYIEDMTIDADLDAHYRTANVTTQVEITGESTHCSMRVCITSPDGVEVCAAVTEKLYAKTVTFALKVDSPLLWWPKNYGGQPLYNVSVQLYKNGKLIDHSKRTIGFRHVEVCGDLKFRVNGVEIKLWGANFVPPYAISHRWVPQRGLEAMQMAVEAGMNAIRIWGEGVAYGDDLYDFADRSGIVIWQDFFIWYGLFPDNVEMRSNYLMESEHLLRRLRHHASIFVWCGGNESYMFLRSPQAGDCGMGYRVYADDLRRMCSRLDPDRYYHMSSPSGGTHPNDGVEGDTHYYNGAGFVRGIDYPVFATENCATTTLTKRSMLSFMSEEEIFPEGYTGLLRYDDYNPFFDLAKDRALFRYWRNLPVPKTWLPYLDEYAHCESWGIERYYDAYDVDSIIHRFSKAASDYYENVIGKIRCGRPAHDLTAPRRCQGHFVWKLNDAFPSINFTLIDAYLELTATYYAVKRAYRPLTVVFEICESIYCWGINDTAEDFSGRLVLKAFSRYQNKVLYEHEQPVFIQAGAAEVLADLDEWGYIPRECLLYASLINTADTAVSTIRAMENERDVGFPPCNITLGVEGDEVVLQCDRYAYCVELDGGDFGWRFEDNYFDMLPFEEKRVRIVKRGKSGQITAKARYSQSAL